MIGPIPVTTKPSIVIGFKGKTFGGITISESETATFTAKISTDNWGETWNHTEGFSHTFNPPQTKPSAGADVKVYIGPKIDLMIADSAGPYTIFDGYLKLVANPLEDPWWNLFGGFEGKIGAELDLWGWGKLKYELPLFDKPWPLAQAPTADKTPPSIPTGLTATPVSKNQVDLSWNASTDSKGVSGYKIFRDGTYLKTVDYASTSAPDSGLNQSTKYCYKVSAVDVANPVNESDKSTEKCATTFSPSKPYFSGAYLAESVTLPNTINFSGIAKDDIGLKSISMTVSGPKGSEISAYNNTLNGTSKSLSAYIFDSNSSVYAGLEGIYTITLTITNTAGQTASQNFTVNVVAATTDGVLSVTPSDGLASSGTQGGAFSPSSKTYTLSNTGGTSINWTASKGQSWVSLSSTGGTLAPGGNTTVTVSINSSANNLTSNTYFDTVSFTNTTNGNGNQSRSVSLTITSGGYSLSGRVTINSAGLSGVTMTLTGATSTSTTTDSNGNYTFTGIQNGSYTITPSLTGYTFSPSSRTVSVNNGNVTGQDFTATTTADTTPPTVPTGLNATAVSSSQINLSWNASTDNVGVAGYKVYRGGAYLKSVTITSTSDTGLSGNTQYCYTVSAYDAAGNESGQSSQACATTQSSATVDTTPPTISTFSVTPSSLTVGSSFTISYTVSDTGGSGLWQMQLWRTTDSNGVPNTSNWAKIKFDSLSGNGPVSGSFTDAPPSAGTYWYGGHGVDNALNIGYEPSGAQVIVNAQATVDATPPSVPTGLNATAVSSSQINLSWNASTDNVGVAGYKVYRGGAYLKSVTITSTSDTGLSGNTQYCYAVSAYDAAGNESGQSSQACATTGTTSTSCIESEPNNSSSSANPLTLNVGCTGYISTSTDVDWFDVYVSSGTTISFKLTVPSGIDYDMELYGPSSTNSSQHWLANGTNNGAGQTDYINSYTTTATGYFAVRVFGYAGAYSTNSTYTITRTQ